MKSIVRRWQELTACLAIVVGASLGAGCASDPDPVVVGQPLTLPNLNEYCAVAQKEVASSRVPARNVLVTDYQAFSRASPSVKPLETMQFVGYADSQRTRPRMISCKLHSAERIRAEYGATAAGEATSCARLNRRTLDAVMASMTERQKRKCHSRARARDARTRPAGHQRSRLAAGIHHGADRCRWHAAHPRQEPGRRTVSTRVSTRAASDSGRLYCHLIAPDYLRRVLTGEVKLPAGEFHDAGQTVSR
jgi:hypothetical protein